MQSTASTVEEYLATVPAERFAALTRLRELCINLLPGYDEVMMYGMPGYSKNGVGEISFNSQKQYISFYVLKKVVVDRYRDQLKDAGKGCIRFRKPEQVDFALIENLLRESAASSAEICP
jgi:uncharacterized protein YdhG (YjbR/CyaY superfamily)